MKINFDAIFRILLKIFGIVSPSEMMKTEGGKFCGELEEFEQCKTYDVQYASGARDCMNIVRDEINKYELNNIDGRNDEIIYRLQKAIDEIINITGVEYE